ncbi:MAG: ATP synthase F1 subunit gamma [Mycoplasma sp.]
MSLDSLKKRITSVKTTSKITNAMKLMASGKLQKQKANFSQLQSYYSNFYDLFANINNCLPDKSTSKQTLHIVINSQLGLCGGYNVNLIKQFISLYKDGDYLLQLGVKGKETYKNNVDNNKILKPFKLDVNNISYVECLCLARYINTLIKDKTIDSIKVHYTKFLNAISFQSDTFSLIPFDDKLKNLAKSKQWNLDEYEFEPSLSQLFENNLLDYFATIIHACISESLISENASRRNAMDTATQNAGDLIDTLSIKYNRERQSKITNEITEITAGSDSN